MIVLHPQFKAFCCNSPSWLKQAINVMVISVSMTPRIVFLNFGRVLSFSSQRDVRTVSNASLRSSNILILLLLMITLFVHVCVLVAQLCPTLCNPTNCTPPGSSVHGILQARILEWVAIPFSRGSSWPRDWTQVSCITGRFFPSEPPGKPQQWIDQHQIDCFK